MIGSTHVTFDVMYGAKGSLLRFGRKNCMSYLAVAVALCRYQLPVNPVTPEPHGKISQPHRAAHLKSTVKVIRDFIAFSTEGLVGFSTARPGWTVVYVKKHMLQLVEDVQLLVLKSGYALHNARYLKIQQKHLLSGNAQLPPEHLDAGLHTSLEVVFGTVFVAVLSSNRLLLDSHPPRLTGT